jgi:hypothetical protein
MTDATQQIRQFRRDGYCVLESTYTSAELARWRAEYDQICAREGELVWLANALEVNPGLFWPAVANSRVLDLLEAILGPFVQLDSLAINAFPSVQPESAQGKVNAWHRDRYALVPETRDYVRPHACNTIFYLQDMTDTFGPLRVVPGSHLEPTTINVEERTAPRSDELLLYPKAGDVVVTHCQLIHSGTPNTSGSPRYFMSANYNQNWMRHRDHFDGPNIGALKDRLRKDRDRRGLRLVGEDPLMWDRVNPYWFTGTDVDRWERWIEEDRAFAEGRELAPSDLANVKPTIRALNS